MSYAFNAFALDPIPYISMLANSSSRAFTFVCISVTYFWVLAISIRCAFPALAAKVFYKSYVANSNHMTVISVTFEYDCPSIYHTAACGSAFSRITADEAITTPVPDGWPVQKTR